MPTGRPKKTINSFPKGWKRKLITLAKEGASEVELRAELGGLSNDTWYRLLEDEPEFSETILACRTLAEAWWVKFGRQHLVTSKGETLNQQMYYLHMKNRFRWSEKELPPKENKEDSHSYAIVVPTQEVERIKGLTKD
jgi:hypothetical protein